MTLSIIFMVAAQLLEQGLAYRIIYTQQTFIGRKNG